MQGDWIAESIHAGLDILEQSDRVAKVISQTGGSDSDARRCLDATGWDVHAASNYFFDLEERALLAEMGLTEPEPDVERWPDSKPEAFLTLTESTRSGSVRQRLSSVRKSKKSSGAPDNAGATDASPSGRGADTAPRLNPRPDEWKFARELTEPEVESEPEPETEPWLDSKPESFTTLTESTRSGSVRRRFSGRKSKKSSGSSDNAGATTVSPSGSAGTAPSVASRDSSPDEIGTATDAGPVESEFESAVLARVKSALAATDAGITPLPSNMEDTQDTQDQVARDEAQLGLIEEEDV